MEVTYKLFNARGLVIEGTAQQVRDKLEKLMWFEGIPHVDEFYWVETWGNGHYLEMGEMTPIKFMAWAEENELTA